MQGVCVFQGILYSCEGFFICLGNDCSCSQLGLFCSTVGICVVFKFLPFRGFLGLPFVFLWAFSHKVSRLVTMVTPIFVLIHCFSRHSGSFGSGAFVKLASRGPTSPRKASSVTLKLASELIPVIIPVSARLSSSLFQEASSASSLTNIWIFCLLYLGAELQSSSLVLLHWSLLVLFLVSSD